MDELPMDDPVVDLAIPLRSTVRIKTIDALIAATARCHNLTLITRNSKAFEAIASIRADLPQAKLTHHLIQAIGTLLAQADALRDRCAEVGILKVVQPGFDQLPQDEGLGAPGQLGAST